MKKLLVIVGILVTSITFGSGNPSLKNEIVKQIHPDLSGIELDRFHEDFVVVSFYVKDFQIHILEIQGSQDELIKMITAELADMDIKREYLDSDIYNYEFTFEKR
ncbi:MAG: hypothetical protein ACI857_000597 [Arenicella sp.]|jgi:hypothetical protein